MKKLFYIICLSIFLFQNFLAQQNKIEKTKILFIGNSYVFYNDLPATLAKIGKQNNKEIITKTFASNGASFEDHLKNEKLLSELKSVKYDFIVLQQRSSLSRDNYEQTKINANKLIRFVNNSETKFLIYVTPSFKGEYEKRNKTSANSQKLSNELNAEIVPVGEIFEKVYNEFDKINLHAEDQVHPNVIGTLLAANLFYSIIFNETKIKDAEIFNYFDSKKLSFIFDEIIKKLN